MLMAAAGTLSIVVTGPMLLGIPGKNVDFINVHEGVGAVKAGQMSPEELI